MHRQLIGDECGMFGVKKKQTKLLIIILEIHFTDKTYWFYGF